VLTALESNRGNFVSISQPQPPKPPADSIPDAIIVLSIFILMAVLSSSLNC